MKGRALITLLTFCLEKPGSTTYTIPSIVREVSAMFVLTMTLRPEGIEVYTEGGHGEEDHSDQYRLIIDH